MHKIEKLFQVLEYGLWHYRYITVVLRVNVAAVLGADVAGLYTYERSIITCYAACQLMMGAAVHIVGVALQGGKVDGYHGAKLRKSYKKRKIIMIFLLHLLMFDRGFVKKAYFCGVFIQKAFVILNVVKNLSVCMARSFVLLRMTINEILKGL